MPLFNPPIRIRDESTPTGIVDTIDFTGAGVSASVTGNVATVNIGGGGPGSFSATVTEIDFGVVPTISMTFTIIDAGVSGTSIIVVCQSGAAATSRSADENEMDPIVFSAIPGTGQFILIATALNGPVTGKYKANYAVG